MLLNNIGLDGETGRAILEGLVNNPNLAEVYLDMSNNDLSKGFFRVAGDFQTTTNLIGLNLTNVNLKGEGILFSITHK